MEVTFNVGIGYVNATQSETFDTLEDYGLTDEEWEEMDWSDKDEIIMDWAWNHIDVWID